MPSRDLSDLHPIMRDKAKRLNWAMSHLGSPILIYCTYRSDEEQSRLYAQGRQEPGRIVTHAKAGQSPHNVVRRIGNGIDSSLVPASLAFDCAFKVGKNVTWNGDWEHLAMIAEVYLDLDWGGRWRGRKCDKPHFQMKNWRDFAAGLVLGSTDTDTP